MVIKQTNIVEIKDLETPPEQNQELSMKTKTITIFS